MTAVMHALLEVLASVEAITVAVIAKGKGVKQEQTRAAWGICMPAN